MGVVAKTLVHSGLIIYSFFNEGEPYLLTFIIHCKTVFRQAPNYSAKCFENFKVIFWGRRGLGALESPANFERSPTVRSPHPFAGMI